MGTSEVGGIVQWRGGRLSWFGRRRIGDIGHWGRHRLGRTNFVKVGQKRGQRLRRMETSDAHEIGNWGGQRLSSFGGMEFGDVGH